MTALKSIKARACWHIDPRRSELREAVLPPLRAGQCRVRAMHSLVSLGTERTVAGGRVPDRLFDAMQVPYMEGSFALPVKYGYSLVGEVTDGPPDVLGRRVHVMHSHQDICQVEVADLYEIPESVPARRAVLASNLETAVTALWDSGVTIGDHVLVVGFGMVGSLVSRLLAAMPGVQPVVLDSSASRRSRAGQMGFAVANPDAIEGAFDVAFNASASGAGLQKCIDAVGFEGRVVELSWYGDEPVQLHLGHTFHSQRKQIISSQVSNLPADRRSRWDYARRKTLVFDLLQDDGFDEHLTDSISFKGLPKFFHDLRQGTVEGLGYVVDFGS